MFLRMLLRAATLRRGRIVSALVAMVVAAAVATAMLNLYVDVQAKLGKEFRNYGANIVITAKDGDAFRAESLVTVQSRLAGRGIAVPFAYVIAQTKDGRSVVVAGTDFNQVRTLDRWWSVTEWPSQSNEALVGVRALSTISPQSQPFDLVFQGRTVHLSPTGILRTGAAEDNRIYIALADFQSWTGLAPSTIEVAASGSSTEVASIVRQLSSALPDAEVHRFGRLWKPKPTYWARHDRRFTSRRRSSS